jgi:hypothetical protein
VHVCDSELEILYERADTAPIVDFIVKLKPLRRVGSAEHVVRAVLFLASGLRFCEWPVLARGWRVFNCLVSPFQMSSYSQIRGTEVGPITPPGL